MEAVEHSLDLLKDTYNYNHWVYSWLRPHLGKRVLEVGSGTGNITRFLLSCEHVVCLEPEEKYVPTLVALTETHRNVQLVVSTIEDLTTPQLPFPQFDTAICLNVLEHIEQDEAAVRKMLSFLRPGGRLILYVPACQWAYGATDKAMGHCRRYNRKRLRLLAANSGAQLLQNRYVNFIGVFGWWWAGKVRGETHIDVRKARLMDRIVPYVASLENLIRPPIGQSIVAVLEKR